MKIEIIHQKNGTYRAEGIELPGSPPYGFGNTKEEAVANLYRSLVPWDGYLKIIFNDREPTKITFKSESQPNCENCVHCQVKSRNHYIPVVDDKSRLEVIKTFFCKRFPPENYFINNAVVIEYKRVNPFTPCGEFQER